MATSGTRSVSNLDMFRLHLIISDPHYQQNRITDVISTVSTNQWAFCCIHSTVVPESKSPSALRQVVPLYASTRTTLDIHKCFLNVRVPLPIHFHI